MKSLLLTGTIQPFVEVQYNNIEKRLSEYVQTIEKYITQTDFDFIVFAENSGYDCINEMEKLSNIALNNNKRFEFVHCHGGVDKRNMSTGEASCMREALTNSCLLKETDYIWKSTGRVFIRNANTITKDHENHFLYSRRYNSLQTYFFGCEKARLLCMLQQSVIDDMSNDCIEYAWMRYYIKNKMNFTIIPFSAFPDAIGIRSSGELYSMSRAKLLACNCLLKLGWYSIT